MEEDENVSLQKLALVMPKMNLKRGLGHLPNRAGHSVDSASHRLVCTTDATNISFTSTMTHEGMEAEGGNGMIEGEA